MLFSVIFLIKNYYKKERNCQCGLHDPDGQSKVNLCNVDNCGKFICETCENIHLGNSISHKKCVVCNKIGMQIIRHLCGDRVCVQDLDKHNEICSVFNK